MSESNSPPWWRATARWIGPRCAKLIPLFAWAFLGTSTYIILGASAFPGWWKRFLLHGGLFDSHYWSVALAFLGESVRSGHPVGLVTLTLGLLVGGWLIFTSGRVGSAQIMKTVGAPPRAVLLIAGLLLALTIAGLVAFPEEYKTPDEVHAELLAHVRGMEFRSTDSFFRPSPPKSGFFLYLDAPKLGRTYQVLQKELVVAAKTTTEEGTAERRGSVDLKAISGDLVSRARVEKTIQMVPADPTPERQAQWLIRTYNDLDLAADVPLVFEGGGLESYEARDALKVLQERGVTLTKQQRMSLRAGDLALLTRKLSRPNMPLLVEGPVLLGTEEGDTVRVTIKWEDGATLTASGTGALANLDDSIHSCATQRDGCRLNASFLGIVWRTRQVGPAIAMDIVPLAIW